jgi:hypothetical protein
MQAIKTLRLFKLARVLVRLDHIASFIVNANHGVLSRYGLTSMQVCREKNATSRIKSEA